ncbi:MAG: class F sortase [Patescibacteria group bacterium]
MLEKVGLTKQGAVAVPKKDSNAAWFDRGARPGELGTSLIVGHYGYWKNGTRGIFNNISKLVKGDKIYVENELGVRTTFIVSGSKSYSLKDDTSVIFDSGSDKAYLNLITCEGIWNPISKSYPKRLVIFAEKEKAAKLTK